MLLDNKKEIAPLRLSEYSVKVIYRHTFAPNTIAIRLHWHDRIEFLRILEGSLIFVSPGSPNLILRPGDVCLISPRMLHSGMAGPEGVVYHVVMFELQMFENQTAISSKYIAPLGSGNCVFEPLVQNAAVLERLDGIIETHLNSTEQHPVQVMGELYDLIGLLYRHCPLRSQTVVPVSEKFSAICEYIHSHYAEPVTTASLSEKFGYSEPHFCRIFKSNTGLTVMQYINLLRMQRAQQLLAETDLPIKNIVLDCGFTDQAYFNNRFRKTYKCSPAQLRKRLRTSKNINQGKKPL